MTPEKTHEKLERFENTYWVQVDALADKFRTETILRICKRKNWQFFSGNGTWFFEKQNGDTVSSVRDTQDPAVVRAITVMCEATADHRSFGERVSEVRREDYKEKTK